MFVFRNSQNTSEIPNHVLNNVAFYLFFIFCCLSVFFFSYYRVDRSSVSSSRHEN